MVLLLQKNWLDNNIILTDRIWIFKQYLSARELVQQKAIKNDEMQREVRNIGANSVRFNYGDDLTAV